MMIDEFTIQEVNTDLADSDEVYVELTKENTQALFDEAGKVPSTEDFEEDDSFVCGDLQFVFEKGTDHITEILLFPVYEDEDDECLTNGDFLDVYESIIDDNLDLIEEVKEALQA